MNQIILASSSQYRRRLLERLGLSFEIISPDLDESRWKNLKLSPENLALTLAEQKAGVVLNQYPDSLIIAGDQVATLDDTIFDKPGTPEQARDQLKHLSGKTHSLITAVCLLRSEHKILFFNDTKLTMRDLSEHQIDEYVTLDRPFDCAGSYRFEDRGICLFQSIETDDPSSIEGLPLMRLTKELLKLGYEVPGKLQSTD